MSLGLLLVKEEKLNGIFSFFNKVVNLFVSFTILIVVQVIFPDELKAQYFILFFVLGMAFSAELGITSYTSIKIANALNGVSYTKVSNVHKFRFDSVKLILSNSLRILAVIYGFLATIVIFFI